MAQVSKNDPTYFYQQSIQTNGGPQVWYNELNKDSGVESYDWSPDTLGIGATLIVRCDWQDRYDLMGAFKNQQHPDVAWMFAETFNMKPSGPPLGYRSWPFAHIEIGYKNFSFDPTDFKEVHVKASAQTIIIPGNTLQYTSGDTIQDITPVFLPMSDIEVTLHFQPLVNEDAYAAIQNTVNAAPFNVVGTGGHTWPAGHLLYLGWDIDEKFTLAGKVFEITHRLLGSPVDQRQQFNKATGDFELVNTINGNNYIYNSGDFSVLGIAGSTLL